MSSTNRSGGRAEAIEVEPGVAGLERVEGPGQAIEPFRSGEFALDRLEPPAQAEPLLAGNDARELRIEARPPLDLAQEREREADRLARGE